MWEPSTSVLPTEGSPVADVIGRCERVPVFIWNIAAHVKQDQFRDFFSCPLPRIERMRFIIDVAHDFGEDVGFALP